MKKKIKFSNFIKSNNGFTIQDLIIATFIITIFIGIIGTLMYSVYNINIRTNLTSQMATYAVQMLEDIDKIPYEEVNSDLENTYKSQFSIPSGFEINIDVSNYADEKENIQDVIKIVNLTISYDLKGDRQEFNVKKLKIKEV